MGRPRLPWFSGVALLPGSDLREQWLPVPGVVRGRREEEDGP